MSSHYSQDKGSKFFNQLVSLFKNITEKAFLIIMNTCSSRTVSSRPIQRFHLADTFYKLMIQED